MSSNTLQEVADAVVNRARRQGYMLPRDIRTELKLAGLPEDRWKDVVALTGKSLRLRQGRYYHRSAISPRLQKEEEQRRLIQRAIRLLIRQHRAARSAHERRGQERVDFIQPVKILTEDEKEYYLLSRDLSLTGIRLLGTRRLLGQKVRLALPREGQAPLWLSVRILWTCSVADELFENGGSFLELLPQF